MVSAHCSEALQVHGHLARERQVLGTESFDPINTRASVLGEIVNVDLAVGPNVRAGGRAIEFEKGKTAIVVPGMDQFGLTIETVIAAVRAGELDELLSQQAKARDVPKTKRGA
jgi:regulator of RNase E activity RraA